MKIKGIIFDMDGVVTQTTDLHFKSWKIILDHFLRQINETNINFSHRDYLFYFDGVSRENGVKNFFNAYKIDEYKIRNYYNNLADCINSICMKKNNLLLSIIAEDKVQVFPDCIEFIKYISDLNYKSAIISSSKNCRKVLERAGIMDLFPVCVDGKTAEEKNIPGKPNPAIFLEAANQLNLLPDECMVVEDALAGVSAAKEGRFGLVVALDRENKLFTEFSQYNPDYILTDLSKKQVNLYEVFLEGKPTTITALYSLPIISSALTQQREVVIFLDYDGTLTPIVDRPQDAHLSPEMKKSLIELCKNYLTLVISGRQLENLKEKIGIADLYYAGNHGYEFDGPQYLGFPFEMGQEYLEDIQSFFEKTDAILKDIRGCIIENKKFTLSVHYRLVNENQHQFISSSIDLLLQDHPKLSRHEGKKVIEIRPKISWNKGIASLNFLKWIKKDNANVIPIYIGDDVTDEDAFQLFNLNGITVKVGANTNTHARYFLESPNQVKFFLDQLNELKE
ncbi:trehalose-phosphatase [Legionella sp.]|uniref:trehalose-phosphatase n=1 Tax=Legionella sp. TaxID=459 RepID=UPI003220879A